MRIAAVVFLVCLGTALASPAQEGGMGTLAGTVVNAKGEPVAGASVTMQNANGADPHATVTNSHGRFFFPELVHGYYDVRAAERHEKSDWKHNIKVTTGKETDVTLRLVPTGAKR